MIQFIVLKDERIKDLRKWTTVEESTEIVRLGGWEYLKDVEEDDKEELVRFMVLLTEVIQKRFNHCEGSIFHNAVKMYKYLLEEKEIKLLDDLKTAIQSFQTVPFNQFYYNKEGELQVVPVSSRRGVEEYIEKYPNKKENFQNLDIEHAAVMYFHDIIEEVRTEDLPLSSLLYTTYNLKYATMFFETLIKTETTV